MLTFLNVTMDICYKIFFYFAKHKDKRIKNNLEKKIAHTKLTGENLFMAENTTCYTHIEWLLINSMANVVQSNFLRHNAVVNISTI